MPDKKTLEAYLNSSLGVKVYFDTIKGEFVWHKDKKPKHTRKVTLK